MITNCDMFRRILKGQRNGIKIRFENQEFIKISANCVYCIGTSEYLYKGLQY